MCTFIMCGKITETRDCFVLAGDVGVSGAQADGELGET